LCRSHNLRLGGVSYLTNSNHKPDAHVLSTPATRQFWALVDGGWWNNPKGVGLNVSYLGSRQTAYQVAVERDHGRLTGNSDITRLGKSLPTMREPGISVLNFHRPYCRRESGGTRLFAR
jgi:hypothetical protein